ncbi:hypothetical protein QCD70_06195 [Agreia sp. PsM10]|uniref:hypothetical protein n=1 Tax=Agreia sp. PsM10 TaxID=3030533 RepID=UPI00263AF14A|nr:hypothetical protein [Agreia sp. PsM10]MDN4639825.1 hypothetical protein [Agreia sp. PsM10]
MMLVGTILGTVAAIGFQFIYVPIATGVDLTVAFVWGIFFLVFEVPVGVVMGACIAAVVVGVDAVLPAKTQAHFRAVAAGVVSSVTFTVVICAIELIVPGPDGFTLAFYASVAATLGAVFGIFAWQYFRKSGEPGSCSQERAQN